MTNETADLSAITKPHFAAGPGPLVFSADRYMDALGDLELTDEQKVELLTSLWGIMRMFVELGVSSDFSTQILRGAGLLPAADAGEEHSNERTSP